MLKPNQLKKKLQQGSQVLGLFISIPHPIAVDMAACAGVDFVIIDTEHVLVNPQTLEDMIRAAEAADITALVRVAEVDSQQIVRLLDAGAQGIVVANMRTPAQVEQLVQAAKYFPQGQRSMNSGRPGRFGAVDLVAYMEQANQQTLLIPMIESRQALSQLREILAVPGIDMVLEGAADMSQSLGLPWQTDHHRVVAAVNSIYDACQGANVPFCAIPRRDQDHLLWLQKGVRAFVLGDDRGTAFRALQARVGQKTQDYANWEGDQYATV